MGWESLWEEDCFSRVKVARRMTKKEILKEEVLVADKEKEAREMKMMICWLFEAVVVVAGH